MKIPDPFSWLNNSEISNPIAIGSEMNELRNYQVANNPVFHQYIELLGEKENIFLPIECFRKFEVKTSKWKEEAIFESSGTTEHLTSKHFIRELELYRQASLKGFRHFYGEGDFAVFALLPGYLERENSSLVTMVKFFIEELGLPGSGFYLNNFSALKNALVEAMDRREKIFLIGVSFALWDFAEQFPVHLPPDAIVMETGGMKGRRKEIVRSELHEILQKGFSVNQIHSEYGMTELLSQAYSKGQGIFRCPPWMKVSIHDIYPPYHQLETGKTGRICVFDAMNIHSCAFIRTDDLGKIHEDGSFEVLGRIDQSDLRGCNLLLEEHS